MGNKKNLGKKNSPKLSVETSQDLTKALKHKPYVSSTLPFPQKQYEPEVDKLK